MKASVHKELTPDLLNDWNALWNAKKQTASAFNSPVWLIAACRAFGHKDIKIVTVYDENRLVAICALTKYKIYGVSVYAAPALEFCDKSPILADWNDWPVVTALTEEMKKLGIIYLTECTDEMANKLRHTSENSAIVFQDDQNPYINFSDSLTGDASPHTLKKIHKRISKSAEPIDMTHSVNDHSDSLRAAFEIELESTKKSQGKSVFQREEARTFYEAVATLDPSLVHGSVMTIGATRVAYSLDFYAYGTFQGSQKAYVRGFEYFQPGKYIIIKLLEWNFENGHPGFDLGRGYDSFKMQFTKNVRPLYTVILTSHKTAASYLALTRNVREKVYDRVAAQPSLYRAFKSVKTALRIS